MEQVNRRTGVKGTVALTIEVLVEIADSDEYGEMVELAKQDLARRILEAPTFLPLQIRVNRLYRGVTVAELKRAVEVPPGMGWPRR